MDNIDLVTFKAFFELEEKGYIKLSDFDKLGILIKKGYLRVNTDTDEKYEITKTGKSYLKFYGKVIWVKPHAINFINDLD